MIHKKRRFIKKVFCAFLMISICVQPLLVEAATVKTLDSNTITNYVNGRVGSAYPNGYCLKFVEECYQNLGANRPYNCCAYKSGTTYITSSRSDNIPEGATVYFGACGGGPCKTCGAAYYGHIGIYVGNGYFVHATGGTVQKSLLSSWLNKYRGWGYCGNFALNVTSSNNPTGALDLLEGGTECIRLGGWAFDCDNVSQALEIHVYIGGPAGSNAEGHRIVANKTRPDVGNAYRGVGNSHGFDESITTARIGSQPVYVYAINVGGGSNILLGTRTVTIKAGHSPTGCLDGLTGEEGAVKLSGWAFDEDALSQALEIHVYIGGYAGSGAPGYRITANRKREDVGKVYPAAGNYHGFSEMITTDKVGNQPVYVYAIDAGSNVSNTFLGSKTVNIRKKHTHSYTSSITKAATCTASGVRTYKCTCGASYTEEIKKTGHQNTQVRNAKAASCISEGYTGDVYCLSCGEKISSGNTVPKKDHTIEKDAAVAASCVATGKTEGEHCKVCGTITKEQQTTPKINHVWNSGKVISEATADEEGSISYTCIFCGTTKIEKIEKLDDDWDNTEDIENTENADDMEETELIEQPKDSENSKELSKQGVNQGISTTKISLAKAVVTLSKSGYFYDGKTKKPSILVKVNDKTLRNGIDYSVSYKNNKNIGTAMVTVTGKGSYTGTATKTFAINVKKGTVYTIGAYKYKIASSYAVIFAGVKKSKTTKVKIPKTVKIGGKNFKVTEVETKALLNNKKLTSVEIGSNVKVIGGFAFAGCSKLKTIMVKTTELKTVGKNAFRGIHGKAKIKVPAKKLSAYKQLMKGK